MAGVDNSLPGLITRCERGELNAELRRREPDVDWRKQEMGGEEEEKCSTIVRGDMRSDVLRRQLEELTTELGGCG